MTKLLMFVLVVLLITASIVVAAPSNEPECGERGSEVIKL